MPDATLVTGANDRGISGSVPAAKKARTKKMHESGEGGHFEVVNLSSPPRDLGRSSRQELRGRLTRMERHGSGLIGSCW